MAENLVGTPAGTIYGTYADAVIYIDGQYGDAYRSWEALGVPDRKRTLLAAARYLNAQAWISDYETFAARDALQAFKDASYELAALVAVDPDILLAADQGSTIARAYAGGAGVDFVTSSGGDDDAPILPPVLMRLIGDYLSGSTLPVIVGGFGVSGDCENPFSHLYDYDRDKPF